MMDKEQKVDVRGDVYEYLLSKIAQSGVNGQFRTPRHIIRIMVEMMDPQTNETICEIKTIEVIQRFNMHTTLESA